MQRTVSLLILLQTFLPCLLLAQADSINIDLLQKAFKLDEVVIADTRISYDVPNFIRMVIHDKTFYKAFQNLRTVNYSAYNNIRIFDKKGGLKSKYYSETEQAIQDKCRTMQFLSVEHSPNFFDRNNDYNFYTAKLFDLIFFTKGKVCQSSQKDDVQHHTQAVSSQDQQYIAQLKQLIFDPGDAIDLPFIKGKSAIFAEKMMPYYDYTLSSKIYNDETDCYVLSVVAKQPQSGQTIIKKLETYFNKNDFQIVARNYELQQSTLVFDYNVKMAIKLTRLGDIYLPAVIEYDGNWDIPLQPRETGKFTAQFYNFH
ncbi:MAG: hypothetical protein KA974_04895 [Saprospiraceae bacterium]|nr:hypothetical protein [Saprospiraceae bacterium]MBP7699124.1 hypothetical protein [Saprospiraceae bacterium]